MVLSLHPGVGGRVFVAGWALGLFVALVLGASLVIGLLGLAADGRADLVRLIPRRPAPRVRAGARRCRPRLGL